MCVCVCVCVRVCVYMCVCVCVSLLTIERFCSTLSWRRNRTNVAFEARPRFSTLSWYVNHVTSGLATVSRRSPFFLTLVVLWLGVTFTFSIWAHGDGKRTFFFVWRKVLSRTRGIWVSRQAKAQRSVAKPKLDVAPGDKSRTCFDT